MYIFLGYIEKNQKLYDALERKGYCLVFKEVIQNTDGQIKGNCDGEMILQAMIDYHDYAKAIIISGDGDFACLVRHLKKNGKLEGVFVPNVKQYSILLKKAAGKDNIFPMNQLHNILRYS